MLRLPVLWLGKLLLLLARLRGGGGSAFPGLVVEKFHPALLRAQVSRLPEGCVLVTGTNGKTTTAKILTTVLEGGGSRVLANRSGSNMVRGLLSTVIEHSRWNGRLDYDLAVFEVDEPNMSAAASATDPRLIVVLNLHRDQLDRYGELERAAELIGASLGLSGTVLLNADDPLVASLADRSDRAGLSWFGASQEIRAELPDDAGLLTGRGSTEPAVPPDELTIGLVQTLADTASQQLTMRVPAHGSRATDLRAHLRLPGVYNAYNATAAIAAAALLGLDPGEAAAHLASVEPAFGRGEMVELDGKRLLLLLVKNPSSFTQVIRTQLSSGERRSVLFAINDNFADGRDISWLWDVDFEAMAGRDDRIVVTGQRGTDLALRLKYTELGCRVEPDADQALRVLADGLEDDEVGYVVPTYTAMLDLRRRLGRRADLKGMWE